MANMLKSAQEFLGSIRAAVLATENTIVYVRANASQVTLTDVVVASYRQDEAALVEASTLMTERRDFIVPAASLTGGVPVDGEEVREKQGSTTYIYVVTGEFGERSWEWHDRIRSAYRIHTIFNRTI